MLLSGCGLGAATPTPATSSAPETEAVPPSSSGDLSGVLVQLKPAADDLARETKFADKDGSEKAFNEFKDLFSKNEDTIKAADPALQAHIEDVLNEVDGALKGGNFDEAARAAQELQDALGQSGSSGAGEPDALRQIQFAAGDLTREVTFRDKEGAQKAFEAFQEVFTKNEDQLRAINPEIQERIESDVNTVNEALKASDFDKASISAQDIYAAINDAIRQAASNPTPATPTAPK
jgi:hypothetical protein